MSIKEMRKRQIEYNKGNIENLDQFLEDNIRQVRHLYNNSNKCLNVVPEKDVRILIFKYKSIIEQREKDFQQLQREIIIPNEDEMYSEMDRKFNLGKHHHEGMCIDDTQIGWEECYKWIKSLNQKEK